MASKFYAVKVGRQFGIYDTWDKCKEQVDGYPGAKYKACKTLEEAEDYSGITELNKENQHYIEDLASGKVKDTCIVKHYKLDATSEQKLELIDGMYYIYYNTNQDSSVFAEEFFYLVGAIMDGTFPVDLEFISGYEQLAQKYANGTVNLYN